MPPADLSCPLRALLAAQHPAPPTGRLDDLMGGQSPRLLYSITDAAEALSISRTLLAGLVSARTIASVKIGGRRLIPRADLEAFVAGLPRD